MKMHPYIYAGMPFDIRSDKIIKVICDFYGVTEEEMFSPCRKATIRKSRQAAHFFLSTELKLSSLKIAKMYGIDHSTVLNSIKKVRYEMGYNDDFCDELTEIRKKIFD